MNKSIIGDLEKKKKNLKHLRALDYLENKKEIMHGLVYKYLKNHFMNKMTV